MNPRMLVGDALLVAGAVLALAFPDLRFFWFQGRPLGILLIIIGVIDVAENVRRKRTRGPERSSDDS